MLSLLIPATAAFVSFTGSFSGIWGNFAVSPLLLQPVGAAFGGFLGYTLYYFIGKLSTYDLAKVGEIMAYAGVFALGAQLLLGVVGYPSPLIVAVAGGLGANFGMFGKVWPIF